MSASLDWSMRWLVTFRGSTPPRTDWEDPAVGPFREVEDWARQRGAEIDAEVERIRLDEERP